MELQDGNFTASIKKVNDSMNGVAKTSNSALKNASSNMKGMFTALMGAKAVTATMGLVKDSIGSAMDRMDTMDQFERTMTVMLGSSKAANAALEKTSGIVKGTAYGMNTAAKSVQGFVTSGLDINKATSSVESWGNAVAFYGDGTDATFGRVTDALSKMSTKGKVNLENLNTAIEAGIPVIDIYAKKTGKSTEEVAKAISSGSVDAKDFMETMNEAFNEGVEGFPKIANAAKEAGASWRGSMDNMKAAVTRGMVGVIQSVDEGLEKINLPSMREGVALFGKGMETIMTAIGTGISNTFGQIGKAIDYFKPQLQSAGKAFTPIVEAAKNTFKYLSFLGDYLKQDLWGMFTDGTSNISKALSGLTELISGLASGVLMNLFEVVKSVAEIFVNVLPIAIDILGQELGTVLEIVKPLVDGFMSLVTALNDSFSNALESTIIPAIQNFSGSLDGIKAVIMSIADVVVPILQDAFIFIGELLGQLAAFWQENGDVILHSVKIVWQLISDTISGVMKFLEPFIKTAWSSIKTAIQVVLDIILGLVKVFSGIISGDWETVHSGLSQITKAIWNGIKGLISNVMSNILNVVKSVSNAIKSVTTTVWNGIKSAMTKPIESAVNIIKGLIDKVKGFFSNMKLSFPKISMPPLPHFSLSGKFSLKPPSVPRLNVNWYETGAIATGPSVVGIGENGSEAILPLSNKARMKPFAQTVGGIINKDSKGKGSGRSYPEKISLEVPLVVGSRKLATVLVDDLMDLIEKREESKFREVGEL